MSEFNWRIARRRGQYMSVEQFLERKRLGQPGAFPASPVFVGATVDDLLRGPATEGHVEAAPHLEDLDGGGGEP